MAEPAAGRSGSGIVRRESRHVLRLTLDAPQTRNALSRGMLAELGTAIRVIDSESTRAVLIDAVGPAFCSGLDLREPRTSGTERPNQLLVDLIGAVRAAPVPVIARVDGHARAGGVVLLGACDVAIAASTTTYAMTETRLGLVPEMTLAMLADTVAPTYLTRWALTAEVVDAAAALRAGLVSEVRSVEEMDLAVGEVLDAVRSCAPGATANTKRLLARRLGTTGPEELAAAARGSEAGFTSMEALEGIAAFRAKRRPHWDVREVV